MGAPYVQTAVIAGALVANQAVRKAQQESENNILAENTQVVEKHDATTMEKPIEASCSHSLVRMLFIGPCDKC